MDGKCEAREYTPTRWFRFKRALFPVAVSPGLPDRRDRVMHGWINTELRIKLDWKDRLRLIVSGRLRVEVRTQTESPIEGEIDSASAVSVLAPWHTDRGEDIPAW